MDRRTKPRVLFVTPEITYLPPAMGANASRLSAKAGGLADVSAALISSLCKRGCDIHLALPDYRAMFCRTAEVRPELRQEPASAGLPEGRIHLAQDCSFYYMHHVYAPPECDNIRTALVFQRDVINHIIPQAKPDLIHCNDWMTGLVPAAARALGIPCLFTIHNLHTAKTTPAKIEDRGIDAASLWRHFYFERYPENYLESRDNNRVDHLTTGVFAAHFVNTVSETFLQEVVNGRHAVDNHGLRAELANKLTHGCAAGIRNAPDPSFNPSKDRALKATYPPSGTTRGKRDNKRHLQQTLGLDLDVNAPLFFWPSRLDNGQKGCLLLLEILAAMVEQYRQQNLQVAVIADGEYKERFKALAKQDHLQGRIGVADFDENLQRLAYGAADFVLMPSAFEPCGLPQMIGALYGALPVVHNTGGLHDTITHLDPASDTGNGFVFNHHDAQGLRWAMNQAMAFHGLSETAKARHRKRIMTESRAKFTHDITAREYICLYEQMLDRPLL